MKKLNLNENNALEITTTLESMLKQKTVDAIEEARKQVAAETFGMPLENNEIQEELSESVKETKKNPLVKNEKGVLHYKFCAGCNKDLSKHRGQMFRNRGGDYCSSECANKKNVSEAALSHHVPEPPPISMSGYQKRAREKGAAGQAAFNLKWHAAKGDEAKRKELKKYAFHNDHDIPDDEPRNQSHSRSAIHSFGEHINREINEEVKMIPYPDRSKHLSAYKAKSDSPDEMHLTHPDGHSLTWHKKDNTFTHTSKDGKTKKGKMVDLHPHLSKVHHDFDGKVQQHMKDHLHDGGMGLLHKMGKLSYAHHAHPEGRDHEEDAINHKAMRSAYLKLTKRDRGVK